MSKTRKPIQDKSQSSIFDFAEGLLSEKDKLELIQTYQNRIEDVKEKTEESEYESSNLRSEQIIISKNNYPSIRTSDNKYQFNQSIDTISKCCHHSKNIYNQCLYEIRLSFFNKIELNIKSEKEKQLRIDIRSTLNKYKNSKFEDLKNKNYKNSIYKLLDKYFKSEKNANYDNYSWSPQASQQIIDICVEAWLDNDLGRRDYDQHPEHRKDARMLKHYTGRPNLPNYRKSSEFISVFTNQQCNIEKKEIVENTNDLKIKWLIKHILSFPESNRLKDLFHKLSRYIINYCIDNKVGTIIIGRSPFWKQNIKLGDKTNQNFVYIPFDMFIRMMKYKGEEIGIDVIVNEEAHTSKCSFLDNEDICHHDKYVGERLTKKGHRGLFRTMKGILINSDVNGAYNIIRKVRPNAFNFKGHGTKVGEVLHPVSIVIKDLLSIRR